MGFAASALAVAVLLSGCDATVGSADLPDSQKYGASGSDPGSQAVHMPGKDTYAKACFSCHQAGLVGAPRLGDREAWAPRIEKGQDVLVNHALNGFSGNAGVMPPRGGHAYLDDEQVTAAVQYMVDAAK